MNLTSKQASLSIMEIAEESHSRLTNMVFIPIMFISERTGSKDGLKVNGWSENNFLNNMDIWSLEKTQCISHVKPPQQGDSEHAKRDPHTLSMHNQLTMAAEDNLDDVD